MLKEIKPHDPNCSRHGSKAGGNRRRRSWTICPVCLTVFALPHLRRRFCCYACKVKAQTTGRRTYRKTITKARSAQSLLRYHLLAGNIAKPSACEECGVINRRLEGAHYNYDEPVRVRWLCRSCHVRWDKREPKGGTVLLGKNALPSHHGRKGILTSEIVMPEKTPAVAAGVNEAEGK